MKVSKGPAMHLNFPLFPRAFSQRASGRSAPALCCVILASALTATAQTVRVDVTPSHVVNKFSPLYALGSTVDRIPSNATDMFFRPDQLKQIQEAGWGVISYRQNTDLFVQAWHWNPKGTWSDPAGKGYFTGDSTPTQEMIRHSYGYQLRHRGFTRNGGTEFDGYSRLDDGDLQSYWKSNPYLTKEFTGEDDSLHPQWVVIALDKKQDINAIRIHWGDPYAQSFEVQYWDGDGDAMDEQDKGLWKTFPDGAVTNAKGGLFTRGFLRAYAREVGLDPEEIIQLYRMEFEHSETPVHAEDSAASDELEINTHRPDEPAGSRYSQIVQVAIILIILGVYFASWRRPQPLANTELPPTNAVAA